MTRAAEFCYLAERRDGVFLVGMAFGKFHWSSDPDGALRVTDGGRDPIARAIPNLGFRKVLAG